MTTQSQTCPTCGSVFTARVDVSSFLALCARWNDTHDCEPINASINPSENRRSA